MIGRALRMLSSKEFMLWLIGMWVIYYVTIAVWSQQAFTSFTGSLRENIFFQAMYVLFMFSAVLNMVRAFGEVKRRSRIDAVLRAVLPAGVIVFLAGFFVSIVFRQFDWMLAGGGDAIRPRWQDEAYDVVEVKPVLKDSLLDTGAIGLSSLFEYEPKAVLRAGGKLYEVGVFPPKRLGGSYYHILNFGMAPGVRLMKGDSILSEGHMALRLLPPGAHDTFEIEPYPYRFRLKQIPSEIMEKGGTKAKLFNLKEPLYEVVVEKGGVEIFRGATDRAVEFDGFSISFYQPDYWVMVEASRDLGLPVLVVGICLVSLGLPLSTALAVRGRFKARGAGRD